jgi:predicted small lipoprotein YifL
MLEELLQRTEKLMPLAVVASLLAACGPVGPANMGGPPREVRAAEIAREPTGDFFFGRRYFVKYTRFWGYLREPRQAAKHAKLVIFNESRKEAPDRLPEDGPPDRRYAFDHNYEYRIWGYYTGRMVYENYSNQVLPEFQLVDYQLADRNPGWLFRPADHYDPKQITLKPR